MYTFECGMAASAAATPYSGEHQDGPLGLIFPFFGVVWFGYYRSEEIVLNI